jgi:hypothetical protein
MANWIAGAVKRPGALHSQLGVPQGEKIPASKLAAAANAGGKLGQRARLAQTLKKMHHYASGGLVEGLSRIVKSSAEKKVEEEFKAKKPETAGGPALRARTLERAEQEAVAPAEEKYAMGGPVLPTNVHGIPIRQPLSMAKQRAARG